MTATQVFFRFAKENGCYDIMSKSARETFFTLKENRKIDKFDSLLKMHGNKNFIVDIILKEFGYSFSNLLWLFQCNSVAFRGKGFFFEINKKWNKYIRENLKGNYLKRMIRDSTKELDNYKYRVGYHTLDFTFK